MIKELIKLAINKLFCCHVWEMQYKEYVDRDDGSSYEVRHYFCKKCGRYKRIKTY